MTNNDDIIDVRAVIERVEETEATVGKLPDDEREEHKLLSALLEDLKGNGGDHQWRGDWYPVTLIRDSYFVRYTEELLTECGELPDTLPHYVAVDWDKTAKNIQVDYATVDFDGVTYWFR